MNRFFVGVLASILCMTVSRPVAAGSACRPDFVSAPRVAVAGTTQSLSTADVNVDGFPDIVDFTGNFAFGISVRLGQADGSFGSQINRTTPTLAMNSQSSVVGNFTNDSNPDAVMSTSSGVYFFAGDGDGTFQSGVSISPSPIDALTAGDFNDDGKLDLAGVSTGPPSAALVVLLGNGNGTFQAPVQTFPKEFPTHLAAGDLDGDGSSDLVATGDGVLLQIYLSLGNGSFAPPSSVTAGGEQRAIRLVDLTGEGDLDVLLAQGNFVAVLKGNGDGTFEAANDYPAGTSPSAVAAGDFDGDGDLDVAAASGYSYAPTTIRTLRNRGDGTFDSGPSYLGSVYTTSLEAADFGNDGKADLIVGSNADHFVSILRSNGDGTFQAVITTPTTETPLRLAAADFDEDGRTDVLVAFDSSIQVFLASGGGAFTSAGDPYFLSTIASLVTADFDGDGHADVAALMRYVNRIAVFLGHGDGTFADPTFVDLDAPNFPQGQSLAAGDFDGDGHADLAAGEVENSGSSAVWTFLGHGDGTFDAGISTATTLPVLQLLAGEFSGDGRTDLAVIYQYPGDDLGILLSQGDGTFAPPVGYATPAGTTGLAAADVRNSGHLDVVVTGANGTLALFPGAGDGTFGAPTLIGIGWSANQIAAADFDDDGNVDFITANYASTNATVLYGLGNGAFLAPREYFLGSPLWVVTGDFDGDGFPDAVFSDSDPYQGFLAALMNGALGARVPDASVVVGSAGELQALTGGFGPLTYQWRRNGVPLSDGGPISGATTPILTIDPATFADADSYDVVVTDSCGPVTSNAATLAVEFADVPVSSPFHDDIIAIATDGITGGCGGSDYCPTLPVRRDQMAAFLLKAEHGSAYTPPACAGIFTDVPCPSPFADWIEQLSAEGVTSGCGTGVYCPSQSVTRAQMAVFLLKTSEGSGYTPPPATGIFGDVPIGSFGADFIEDLYTRGITGGCSAAPLLYCPASTVLRQQMATFLVRTFFP